LSASKTFSGARALFLINSVPIGFAGGMSGSEEIDYEPVDVLNHLEVSEHVPVAYRCSLNAQVFRVVGSSLKALGIIPRLEDIITSGDLTAAVQDSVTGATVAMFTGVRASSQNFDVTARGLVQTAVSFVAIRHYDEWELPAGG